MVHSGSQQEEVIVSGMASSSSNDEDPQPASGDSGPAQLNSTAPLAGKAKPTTLVDKIKRKIDRSLKREGPATIGVLGSPVVLIPDEVYIRGAEVHKEYLSCFFCGKAPSYKQIQSVVNSMWGKGKHVEIHTNFLSNSMIVRIPNDFIRNKIIEKRIWYIGDSMLYAYQWGTHSPDISPLTAVPMWAHLHHVPLDLRSLEGLGWVAGALGNPKETDDFTINMVSLIVSHVKVEMDLTKPLPRSIELPRQNGEIALVEVDYPWVPLTCSNCNEMGHIMRNCLLPHKEKQPKVNIQKGALPEDSAPAPSVIQEALLESSPKDSPPHDPSSANEQIETPVNMDLADESHSVSRDESSSDVILSKEVLVVSGMKKAPLSCSMVSKDVSVETPNRFSCLQDEDLDTTAFNLLSQEHTSQVAVASI